jgi:hypothetical protein
MKLRGFRRQASVLAAAAAALLSAGCDFGTDPLFPIFWTGVFHPESGAAIHVAGTTEMVANPSDTSVGVFLDTSPGEELTLSWHIRNGTCDGGGVRVAALTAFPPVQVSEAGSGIAIAQIRRRLPSGNYAAEVFSGAEASGGRLACADLRES